MIDPGQSRRASRPDVAFVLSSLACVGLLATGPALAAPPPVLQHIQQTGVIRIAHRESSVPFSFVANGKPVGYAVDLCLKIADAVRSSLHMPGLRVEWVPVTPANRIAAIAGGKADLECGSTTNNATRQKDVDFAHTTYVEVVRIAVKANSGIKDLKDLNGKTVATTTGTTSVQTLRKNERAQGIDFKEVMGKDHADSFLLLESGRADAFVMDGSILAANISKAKSPKDFAIVGPELSVEPIACMVRKGDAAFLKAVDASIDRQIKDGSLAKLYDKWFMQPIPPTNTALNLPLSDATKAAWANPNNKPMEDYARK